MVKEKHRTVVTKNKQTENISYKLTRRDALKKAGKYAAFTALASLVVLSPKQSQADSPPDPGWGK
jgi:hypothetical protein